MKAKIIFWTMSLAFICVILSNTGIAASCTSSASRNLVAGDNVVNFQTSHNYANNMNCYSAVYKCPAGYLAKVNVKYDTESSYDFFYIYDYDSGKYNRWSGTSNGFVWLTPSNTDDVRFRFTSDASIIKWGVDVDKINCYKPTTTTTTVKPTTSTTTSTVPQTTTTTQLSDDICSTCCAVGSTSCYLSCSMIDVNAVGGTVTDCWTDGWETRVDYTKNGHAYDVEGTSDCYCGF